MSFGESMFSTGFNQKIVKEDLFVNGNRVNPRRYLRGKTLENSRRQIIEVGHMTMTCEAGRPHCQAGRPVGPHLVAPPHYVGSPPPQGSHLCRSFRLV
jgi:hypothetical protein